MSESSRIEDIFLAALEKGTLAERAAYLDAACQGDAELRRRVERLLAAHPQAGGFLEQPPRPDAELTVGYAGFGEQAGTVIAGRYKLLEEIGEGGMGTVWIAEQSQPVRRKVALKLVKAGMDSKSVLARFEAERQALALMDHPNIAKVFDGGVTDQGRPFFVMEYVKGVPLTQYCDDNRLTVEERLALFVPVCQAVQHAHQKGIIHRDLKPSNVLICLYDGQPMPKVIDFGLAKAIHQPLTEHTLHTAHGVMIGTPLYMSPEQAEFNNLDVDTRTDVYSLGVILYELLTGTTPLEKQRFQEAALQEMLRLIKEEEPLRPSTRISSIATAPSIAAQRRIEPVRLSRLLQGELDWIVMKALEKERARRYGTAADFAADVERLLRHDVVQARPPSPGYRIRKFVARHRGPVTAASILLLFLVIGIVGTTWGMFRAWTAEALSARALEDVQVEQKKNQAALQQVTAERVKTQAALQAQTAARLEAEQSDREARWHLYKARQYPLREAWQARDFGKLEGLLAESTPAPGEPDFRGWEWYYFQDQCRQASTSHPGSAPYNGVVSVSRKGGRIAAATRNASIDLWAPGVTRIERTLTLPFGSVKRIAWSPTAEQVACVYGGHKTSDLQAARIRVWSSADGATLHDFQPFETWNVTCFAWHPDGQRIAAGHWAEPEVRIWDLAAEKIVQTLKTKAGAFSLDWHPDGVRLAAGHRGGNRAVYDAHKGQKIFDDPKRINDTVARCVRWSPDGTQLAVGHTPECIVYDAQGTVVREFPCGLINDLNWSPDGRFLLAGAADQTIDLWDVTTGETVGRYRLHNAPIEGVGWTPDGETFYSASLVGGLRSSPARPPISPAKRYQLTDVERGIRAFAWSPDGRWFACICDQGHLIVDARTGQLKHRLQGSLNCWALAWKPDSSQLITPAFSGKDESTIWDVHTGLPFKVFTKLSGDRTACIAWSPDGRQLAAGGFFAAFWDVYTGTKLPLTPKAGECNAIAYSPDGQVVACTGKAGLTLFVPATNRKIPAISEFTGSGEALAWSPDGKHVAVGLKDGSLQLYQADDNSRLLIARGHAAAVVSVCWSPDGHRIATAGSDHTIMIWDAITLDHVVTLPASTSLRGLSWSPDGRQLAAADTSGTIDIWGTPTLQLTPQTATHLLKRESSRSSTLLNHSH